MPEKSKSIKDTNYFEECKKTRLATQKWWKKYHSEDAKTRIKLR